MLFEFVSMALVWLFELVSIAKISKNETKMVNMKSRCQNPKGFAPDDLTRPGQRPGELHYGYCVRIVGFITLITCTFRGSLRLLGFLIAVIWCRNNGFSATSDVAPRCPGCGPKAQGLVPRIQDSRPTTPRSGPKSPREIELRLMGIQGNLEAAIRPL